MKDQRRTEIKVGIMVVVGVLIFIWILSWAKNFSFTSTDKILYVKFSSVSGLEIGDYVMVNGVRKGNVQDFNVQGENVIVKLIINSDVALKKDAVFSVSMLDLMGGKKIEVKPGSAPESLDYAVVQQGNYYADIPAVMAMIGNVQDDLYTTIKDVKITLKSLNAYLTDEKLNRDVKSSLSNMNEMTSKINLMIDENRNGIKELTRNAVDLTDEAKDFISANRDGINSSVKDLQVILKRTDTLLTTVNNFTQQITDKNSNINKFLNDKDAYENLIESVKQLKELSGILLEQIKTKGIKIDTHLNLF